jgi:sugar lactone lactonase YvrE
MAASKVDLKNTIHDLKGVRMSVTRSTLQRAFLALLLIVLSTTMIGAASAKTFPDLIPLPNGFQPEGIAVGKGNTFYVGSIPTGAVWRGDLRTGEGDILVPAQEGRAAIGLKYDRRTGLLFVAGGPTGSAFIYDGETGKNVADIQLNTQGSFINDVVLTRDAAYFTNSNEAVFYRVPLRNNGKLPSPLTFQEIPLTGDYQLQEGFNSNGIEATPNGKTLIIVNSADGVLYNVDPTTGEATRIDLGGESVPNGDGLLLQQKTLYVVQNSLNKIAVIELNPGLTSGSIVDEITNEFFRVPTTIARFGNALYAVNARFDTPPTPESEFEVVRVPRR